MVSAEQRRTTKLWGQLLPAGSHPSQILQPRQLTIMQSQKRQPANQGQCHPWPHHAGRLARLPLQWLSMSAGMSKISQDQHCHQEIGMTVHRAMACNSVTASRRSSR